ncbi:MAG: DNA/RNA nuclease SfsA [Deltaproteobacteria bacterium]|jgi:sugar fermentation stimulation protein A|nr:DNA/RNA nuclease SfsA [Deltaproteobacteria bacterium]MBT4267780.1 DNA/RNA nuclease SfsA [Deltaproteobacteria bacterium]MBT4644572.1 DNA/RNA nuclease SfsA [Deltaproteobacteria bacterium]MBT6499851.1 DNA/RNA nuclease SfsA [Deltaproteobacteria bacterium]MBT6614951.1 DNA/RNA nuclease SfsA [Deltaproteobacteria bacterium]
MRAQNSIPNKIDNRYLRWPELISGTLVKRYKRFLADIRLDNGQTITAHCANTGSMTECSLPGSPVYVSYHDNPQRKLKYTWELIQMPTSLVGVNTAIPNKLVFHSIQQGLIQSLLGYEHIKSEKKLESGSRLDIFLWNHEQDRCFIEIKNCTLVTNRIASFPDAVTTRGQKHLRELQQLKDANTRCAMFFLIQRSDADIFKPADSIDPEYGRELRRAADNGVEMFVYDVDINLNGIRIHKEIPYQL